MKPDIDLQLQVVLRSLKEVVLPSIDPDNKPANEQINLCLHNLNIVKNRFPYQRRFIRAEIKESVSLVEQINTILESSGSDIDQELSSEIMKANCYLEDPDIDTEELSEAVYSLRLLISETVQHLADNPVYPKIERCLIEHSKRQLDMTRAWFIDCGIEPDPDQVPGLDTVV